MPHEAFWMPVYCRLIHRPARYPLPTFAHWRYAYCDTCRCYRWVVKDRIVNILLGRSIV